MVIEAGPGIASLARLVLAGSPSRAQAILDTWSTLDRLSIAFAGGFDYLFGVLLFGTLAIGCAWLDSSGPESSSRSGPVLVWLATLAIVLDIPENAAYLVMVFGNTAAPWPQVALLAGVPRAAIFIVCIAFVAARIRHRTGAA